MRGGAFGSTVQNVQNFYRKLLQKIVPEKFTGKSEEAFICTVEAFKC